MWLLSTVGSIAKSVALATKKSFEFGIDIAEEVAGTDDEFDGVWGTIWGSWEDNILGAAGEEGAVQHLFGEQGAGGRFFGMIPEPVRKPVKHVITPVFEGLDLVYEHVVDRPLATMIGVTQQTGQDAWDVLSGKGSAEDLFTYFNPNEWIKAYEISGSRSFGQALALAASWIDLDDAAQVKAMEGTGFYKMFSGTFDALGNIILDPANLAFGAGIIGKPGKLIKAGAQKAVPGLATKSIDEAIATGQAFKRFDDAIEELRYTDDLKWSLEYMSGRGFSVEDLANVDILTARILENAKKGKLGTAAKKLNADQARAIASLPNKKARDMYFRLVTTGGDAKVMDEMNEAARLWAASHQDGGLHHQLKNILDWQTNANSGDIADFLIKEQRRLENLLMDQNPNLPFGAALSIKEERLRALSRRQDVRRDYLDPDELNAFDDALNDMPHLVSAAADQVLLNHGFDTMSFLPGIGKANELTLGLKASINDAGFVAKTLVEKVPLVGGALSQMPARVVHAIAEKVPQGIIIWDDADQAFNQFQRMLRDASRIVDDNGRNLIDQAFVDETLGKWTSYKDINAQKKLFNQTVEDVNTRLVHTFMERMHPDGIPLDGNWGTVTGAIADESAKLTQILQRQYKQGQDLLKSKSKNARIYGNKQIRIDHAFEGGEVLSRFLPITPQQLQQSSLVPRYDLYRRAFNDGGVLAKSGRRARQITSNSANAFTSVWKKGVLMRPAWPMRVLTDEYARAAAQIGTIEALKSMPAAFNDLRANWFRSNKVDLGPHIREALEKELDMVGSTMEYPKLVEQYVAKAGSEDAEKLVRNVIWDQYGKKKANKRTGIAALAGFGLAGPVGLGAAGLYGAYLRGSVRRVAQLETGTAIGFQLRTVARGQLADEIKGIRTKLQDDIRDKSPEARAIFEAAAKAEIETLQTAARLLETQAEILSKGDELAIGQMKETNVELYNNFDKAGIMLTDAGMANVSMNGYMVGNAFGNNPVQMQIYRNAMSSDGSNRAIYESFSETERRQTKYRGESRQYVHGQSDFEPAWNDTVNKQFVPMGDDFTNNAFQDLSRMIWRGADNEEILRWMRTDQGDALRYAMPHYFGEHVVNGRPRDWQPGPDFKGATDDFDYLGLMREEFNSLLPDIEAFQGLRARASRGEEINWGRDVEPILNNHPDFAGKSMDQIRVQINEVDFGRVMSDSSWIEDAAGSAQMLNRVRDKIDSIFTNIGTMPTDVLTRSLIFQTTYKREMSRRLASMGGPDAGFLLKESDIRRMETQARQVALSETKNLMYDLAERSKFEEVVSNLIPFYGAWQEVITRWGGLAARNPAFVMAGARNFRKGMETFDGVDEETGEPLFVLRFPEGVLNWELPIVGKAFGRMSALGDSAIDFNFSSASMISAGMPGFGPMVSIPASETALELPEVAEALEIMLPFGPVEGQTLLSRVTQQVLPTWLKTASGTQFNTASRQSAMARITADLAQEYYMSGRIIDSESDWNIFEEEVAQRTRDLLTVRMLGNLALPVSFVAQSPHYKIISQYSTVRQEKGLEAADEWLISKHPEMWAILGRQTKVKTVASATLEGEKNYQKYKEFADENESIHEFVTGKVGAIDVGFEYNRAVQTKEINEGRRVRLNPREIYTRGQEFVGGDEFRDRMRPINAELTRRGLEGLSVSLNAKTNEDLATLKRAIVEEIAVKNPLWKEKHDSFKGPDEKAEVIHSFRAAVDSELFVDRPEMLHVARYMEVRDKIATELERRAERNSDWAQMGHDVNADLKELWLRFRLEMSQIESFNKIMDRYFNHDESIERATWPSNWAVQEYQEVA